MNEVVPFTDAEGNGRLATADRNGFFYVLNREDGSFVDAYPFVKEINWAEGIDDNGRPIYIEANRPGAPNEAAEGGKGETVFSVPSFLGGKNWMPMAYSQKTGLFYVPSNEWGMDIWDEPISLQEGRRLSRRRLHHQAAVRGLHRLAEGDRPCDRRDQVGVQERLAALGRA